MKKNFKRLLSGAMALIMAAGLMAGCSGGGNADSYQIDWYIVTGSVPSDTKSVEAEVDKYLAEKLPGTTLKLNFLNWGEYDSKLNVMMAGGEKFDICYTSGNTYRQSVAKNAFVPLNDLMDKYAPKTKEIIGEEFLKGSQINGESYGVPANKDKGANQGIMYRADIAEELGLTEKIKAVKTMDEFREILRIVQEKKPDITPLLEQGSFSEATLLQFKTIAFPIGFYPDDETMTPFNFVETEEYRQACLQTAQNRKDGLTEIDMKESAEKHFAQFIGLKPGKAAEYTNGKKYKYEQLSLTPAYMEDGTGSLMAISRTSEDPERAMKFLELFNTDPYLNNLIVYGIEGKHYEKIDDKYIKPIANSGYGNAGMQWSFGNTFINYLTEGEDPDKVAKMEEYNANLERPPYLGFAFDGTNVKSETGACQNIFQEYSIVLSAAGAKDVDATLKEYRDKLKAAGADKILAEVQRQVDEWKKANNK